MIELLTPLSRERPRFGINTLAGKYRNTLLSPRYLKTSLIIHADHPSSLALSECSPSTVWDKLGSCWTPAPPALGGHLPRLSSCSPRQKNLLFWHLLFMNFYKLPRKGFSHRESWLKQQEDMKNAHSSPTFSFIGKLMRSICKGHRHCSPRCTPGFPSHVTSQVNSITKVWLCDKRHPPWPEPGL